MAHPGLYENWNIIDKLIKGGLLGIEAYHPKHSQKDREEAFRGKRRVDERFYQGIE